MPPDILDAEGLQVKTAQEIRSDLETGLRAIYGQDINLDQNSPDGQQVGIITQIATDLRELLVAVNNGFDPDRALGRLLDERVVINNIERVGATYTTINISITVDQTVTLEGLDENYNDPQATAYTVQDNAGNQFILADTDTLTAGTHSLTFRAKEIGQVETTIGTITNPVTIVLGVTGINNPAAAVTIGQNEETDAQLRVRRQRSVANSANGYLNGLLGLILSLDGVTDAALYENYTDVEDSDGIPPHAIWAVVEGGANQDIGETIYERKSYGCNMKGTVEVPIETASGQQFVAQFDRPTSQNLYIQFEIKRTNPNHVFDLSVIKNYIEDNVLYQIGEFAETSLLTSAAVLGISSQGGGGVPINMEISDDGYVWVDFLEVNALDDKWVIDADNIDITVVS
jgi:uncharacterized phage protein gp47/JayE